MLVFFSHSEKVIIVVTTETRYTVYRDVTTETRCTVFRNVTTETRCTVYRDVTTETRCTVYRNNVRFTAQGGKGLDTSCSCS